LIGPIAFLAQTLIGGFQAIAAGLHEGTLRIGRHRRTSQPGPSSANKPPDDSKDNFEDVQEEVPIPQKVNRESLCVAITVAVS
jgi:hypothetical protein